MSYTPPSVPAPRSSSNTLKIILFVVGALVVLCICIPICIISVLALLGPQTANVLSQITGGVSP